MNRQESTYNHLRALYPIEQIIAVRLQNLTAYAVKISDGIRIYSADSASFLGAFKDQKTALSYFKNALLN
jgi:hypothetical protein